MSFPPTPAFFPPTPTLFPTPPFFPTPGPPTPAPTAVSCRKELSAAASSLIVWLLVVVAAVYFVKFRRPSTTRTALELVEAEKQRRIVTLNKGEVSRLSAATHAGRVTFLKKPLERFVDWFRGENDLFCIWFPSVLEPLDQTQRAVVCAVVIAFVFAISSFWSSFLMAKVSDNKWLSGSVNVLLTGVLTAIWAIVNRKVINFFAVTERFPLLHSRVGRMLPSLIALTLALALDVLCFVYLFADTATDSCVGLLITHVYPFLANLFAHYLFPGIPVAYFFWVLRARLGVVSDGQAELDKLFQRLSDIAREQDGATDETKPLLTG